MKPKSLYSIGSLLVHMVQKRDNIELDIIEVLIRSQNHIRGIAKKLNESHSTILRKLNMLQKANVIDSKREGRNKIFFLKKNIISRSYIYKAEINKLIKIIKKHPKLGVIFEEILKKTKEKTIILFGSYAKGIEKENSDIDIYVNTKNRNTKKIIEDINSKINVKIGIFNTKSLLIKEIIKDHIIIRGVEELYEKHILE